MGRLLILLFVSLMMTACFHAGEDTQIYGVGPDGPAGDNDNDNDQRIDPSQVTPVYGSYQGVDILVVVDNSSSMAQEQEILATSIFALVNSLVNPLPTSPFPAADDVRVAVTTSDMGLQWGGNAFNPASDGWPGGVAPGGCEDPLGNNGWFVSDYASSTVNFKEDVIQCESTGVQCPSGWDCGNLDASRVGTCSNDFGDGTNQACPPSPASYGETYLDLQTNVGVDSLSATTACLANVGTEGCGLEQQMMAASSALQNNGLTTGFIRDDALLVVLVISDEEDCSIKDGPALFASDEVSANSGRQLNLACGRNKHTLYSALEIKQSLQEAKAAASGNAQAGAGVVFAAIVGVPPVPECQGKGTELGACLDYPLPDLGGTMGEPATVVRETSSGALAEYYAYACERYMGNEPVTQAYPGTRFVELAQEFGHMSYIHSICNQDWSPAMRDIASLIRENLETTCYPDTIEWDGANQVTAEPCDFYMQFHGTTCPGAEEWAGEESSGSDEAPLVNCVLPKIPLPLACGDIAEEELARIMATEFGWTYCENAGEATFDACMDGLDNDGDGMADCDDVQCAGCGNCSASGETDTTTCPYKCRANPILTDGALVQAAHARYSGIHCANNDVSED